MTKTHRAVRVLTADRRASIILLLQAPILAAMAALVVADGAFTDIKVPARELLVAGFAMSIIMIWLGLINSVREFSKERRVWARERMAGASLWAYIGSKVIVQWSIVTAQALVLLVIVSLFRTGIAASNSGVTTGHIELLVTLALTGMAASSIGLVVSASVSNEDRGSSLVPYLIIPQYLLSGIAIAIPASTMWVSSLTIPYWSVAALASTLDACSRPFVGGPTCSDALRLPIGNEPAALLSFWAVLGGICVVSIAIVAALLMLRDRARNVR